MKRLFAALLLNSVAMLLVISADSTACLLAAAPAVLAAWLATRGAA